MLASGESPISGRSSGRTCLRVGRKAMQPKGALALHDWLRGRLAANAPFDGIAATC